MFDIAYPCQVILVTTRGSTELLGKTVTKDNIITMAWHSPLSFEPMLYGISIGKTRFSHKLVEDSKVFAVNFMTHDHKDKALYCGRNSGISVDKFEKSGLTKEECESIDCCRIKEAAACLECEVIDSFDVGDHTFFVGKIIKAVQKSDKKRLLYSGREQFTTTA